MLQPASVHFPAFLHREPAASIFVPSANVTGSAPSSSVPLTRRRALAIVRRCGPMRAATPTEAAAEAGAPFLAKKPPYGHGQWKVWTAAEASAASSKTPRPIESYLADLASDHVPNDVTMCGSPQLRQRRGGAGGHALTVMQRAPSLSEFEIACVMLLIHSASPSGAGKKSHTLPPAVRKCGHSSSRSLWWKHHLPSGRTSRPSCERSFPSARASEHRRALCAGVRPMPRKTLSASSYSAREA